MTIRFLVQKDGYSANSRVTLAPSVEAAYVAGGHAAYSTPVLETFDPSNVAITGGVLQNVGVSLAKVAPIAAWPAPKLAVLRESVRAGLSSGLLVMDGDSIVHGWANGASGLRSQSIPALLAQMLTAAGIPAENDSWFGLGGEATLAALSTYDPRITFGAGWVASTIISVGGKAFANNTTTNALSVTPTFAWDTAEIWTQGQTGVACPFTCDVGGAVANLTTTASTFVRHTYSPGSKAVQTLSIKRNTAGSEVLTPVGIHCWDSTTKRVAIFNFGVAGATSSDKNVTSAASSPNTAYTTIASGAMGGSIPVAGSLSLGINDRRGGPVVDLATYQANMQALITTRKALGDLLAFIPPPSKTSDTAQATQDLYDNALRALCVSNGVPCFDTPVAWNYWAGANAAGLFGSDNLHTSVPGLSAIASEMMNRIMAS
jgi:hypothetical protein